MADSMSLEGLVATLKASLQDAASVFGAAGDADFERHIQQAALAMDQHRPYKSYGELTLVAGTGAYALPTGFGRLLRTTWGQARLQPWETGFSGRLPRLSVAYVGGVKKLVLDPAPTQAHIDDAGVTLPYWYTLSHVIGATDGSQTTVPDIDRGLLILRAQAEAMKEMAFRNIQKPAQVLDGYSNAPRNGTPAALANDLLNQFCEAAA